MRETLNNRGGCAKLPFLLGLGFQTPLPGRTALLGVTLPLSLFISTMSNLSQVTIVYGENKLQKTIKLPASTTVTDAKKTGSDIILKHLRDQPGVPPSISIDDECTDFYPGKYHPIMIYDLHMTRSHQMLEIPPGCEI
jgi:hypothetical protein